MNHFNNYYRPLAARNIATDILSADAPLEDYKLVIAPSLLMLNETRAAGLITFIENGGHLVLTLRSGMKDDYNALLPTRQPGMLAVIAGVEVEDYYALRDPVPVVGDVVSGESILWAERLKIQDEAGTKVIARYGKSNGWLDHQVAITSHPYGKGYVTYVGAYLNEEAQRKLIDDIVQAAGVQSIMESPAGVEVRKRINGQGGEVFIIINHEQTEKYVNLPWQAREHLSGRDVNKLQLEPYGVAIITH